MPFPHTTFSPAISPDSICLLRLSALGDITHMLPVVRTLQQHWPQTKLTWVIGRAEYPLVKDIADIEFIIFDKTEGWRAYLHLKKRLGSRSFDILMHMQLSLRASVISTLIHAKIRLGFDKARAKDMQWLFSNEKISPLSTRQHVVDSFLEFPRHFGLTPILKWALPVNPAALDTIRKKLATDRSVLVINPCAVARSKSWRNWTNKGYAQIADYAAQQCNMQVVLSGGPAQSEKNTAEDILALCEIKPVNLVGKTHLDEMVALLKLANIVIAPDTGPIHVASALGTSTIGLYAATNPQRAGPYNFMDDVVNKYPQALQKYYQQDIKQAAWGKRIKTTAAMTLISVDEVLEKLEAIHEPEEKIR